VTTTLVYAVGNRLRGDDGVGPATIEMLQRENLGPNVELIDAGLPGLEAALAFHDRRQILLIDAVEFGAAPGTVRKFTMTADGLGKRTIHPNSLHAAGLLDALGLAAALGVLPPNVTLFAVQPHCLGYEVGLSPSVRAVLPCVVEAIRDEILEVGTTRVSGDR
jgi:hydrogenase maturation protease